MLRVAKGAGLFLLLLILIVVGALFAVRDTVPNLNAPEGRPAVGGASEFAGAIEKSWVELNTLRRDDMYPSISVAAYHDGRLLWADATGYADIKNETPADVTTRYLIGSISKPFTAALVMKLVEDGRIELDLPISSYAPDLPKHYENVTLRHLLSHQAGVRHYNLAWTPPFFTEFGLNEEFASVKDSLRLFIDDPLLFEPDSGFQYTTFGYTLVAYVLEEATGTPFLDLLDQAVLRPLGLLNTSADIRGPRALRVADLYMVLPGGLGVFQPPETNPSHKRGGGGLISTPTELGRFGDALLNGGFLSQEAFEEMTTPRKTRDGEDNPRRYGLGWRRRGFAYPRGSENIIPLFHHGGTAVGSQCALVLAPEFKVAVAICGNAYTGGSSNLMRLAAYISGYFFEAAQEATPE
jgi:CubicO group peptidase (beta-lactamase class C family)